MRQDPPLGKPARVSDSRRESSVSESEAFSSRAGLCGGNAAVRTHWKTTVTNETGYRRGGLGRKKRPGHPLFPATLQRERANQNRSVARPSFLVTLDNFEQIARACPGDVSFKCLPYQLSMVRAMPTMVVTGNGESGFDSGEGA
uniref:Uncharacterized protein n=1 Tax=Magallana gigas TaxID=29159 RepID=K1P265_MAGGI